MIEGLKPYPRMKDSGVEWLGEVPEHWEVVRLKAVAMDIVDLTAERRAGEFTVTLEDVQPWTGWIKASTRTAFSGQAKRFRRGDILFGKLRPYLAKEVAGR